MGCLADDGGLKESFVLLASVVSRFAGVDNKTLRSELDV